MTTQVHLSDLVDAFQWVSAAGAFDNTAYVDRRTGRIWLVGEWEDEDDPVPDDVDDAALYLEVLAQGALGLGRRLALRFAYEHAP